MAGERVNIQFQDYSQEFSTFSVAVGPVTAVSLPGLLTQVAALKTATDNITLGNISSDSLTAYKTPGSAVVPTDVNAQRERKWLVRYVDNDPFLDALNAVPNPGYNQINIVSIPTAELGDDHLLLNSDDADLENADIAAFVTAFEAIARSPTGGTVTVIGITHTGRNT